MIGKLICWWTGKHKRGRRVTASMVTTTSTGQATNRFECPRCGSQWTRQAKA
jgi:predicted RNA-binding Zn-ribbon protein involved in translation (DUF1610 family)